MAKKKSKSGKQLGKPKGSDRVTSEEIDARNKSKSGKQLEKPKSGDRITLEEIDAISSEDDSDEDSQNGEENEEWNAEALALRQAIADGAFNELIQKKDKISEKDTDDGSDNEQSSDREEIIEGEVGESEDEEDGEQGKSDSEDEKDGEKLTSYDFSGRKAILTVTEKLLSRREIMPWSENFCIIPSTPLPFGGNGVDGSPLDIHDDLKREFSFYSMALEAVNDARACCEESGVPFARPEDFFAEMMKSDDHMAKVKDRLIFETKKIDAVAQRKTNKEHKLRAKEKQSNKIAEKAKKKKEHFDAIDEWTSSAPQNKDGDDAKMVGRKRMWTDRDGNMQDGPNKKRHAADKKYGFGGKTGKFKQNDPKSMDDLSSYNPKGNFGGLGSKSKGGGNKRKGKRARDSARSR